MSNIYNDLLHERAMEIADELGITNQEALELLTEREPND